METMSCGTLFLGYAPDLADNDVLRLKNGNVLSRRVVCDPMLQFGTTQTQDKVLVQYQQPSSNYGTNSNSEDFETIRRIVCDQFSFDENPLRLALLIWKNHDFAAKLINCAKNKNTAFLVFLAGGVDIQDALRIHAD